LKFLPPQWSHDEGAKQRFLREAQAASATNHRNICIIHDISQTDDGQLFIVMACYEGRTLKDKLQDGPLPVVEAVDIATEAAEGLAKAHAQGVVHRDIKPGNLMITEDGVKVLDFGLAKFADALQLTMPGSTLGTFAYMSPEQARGEEADARSDVWALGVVLYEMLSGRVPFGGAYPEAIFHAIKNEPVPLLVGAHIPTALQTIVFRALEKDPERRYQSARELARDLRLLQGRTIPLDLRTETLPLIPASLGAPGEQRRPGRIARLVTRRRAAAAAAILAAAAAGTYLWQSRPVVRVPVAIAAVANHTGEPELDGYRLALTSMLVNELAGSPNVRVVPYVRLLEIVRRFIGAPGAGDVSGTEAIQAIATESSASVVVVPSLEYMDGAWFAQVQLRSRDEGTVLGSYRTEPITSSLPKDTALRLVTMLADAVQSHFEANGPGQRVVRRPASARLRNLDAARAFAEGLNGHEQLEYAAARAAFERAAELDDQHAMTHAWLSRTLLLLGRRDEAVAAARKARELTTSDLPVREATFIEAVLAESQADLAAAEQGYRRLVDDAPDDLAAHIEAADFLKRQGQNQEAIAAYQAARQLESGYTRVLVDLCQISVRLDDYPQAERQAQAALDRFRRGGDRGGEAQALLCLGDAQRAQGGEAHLADARRNIESARTIFEGLKYEYGLSRTFQYLGLVAGGERDYASAARNFEEALARSRAVGNRAIEGLALINLGVTFEVLGQRAQVLKYHEEARDFYQRTGDEQRAAEQEANAAALLIDYGTEQVAARRRIANARATFQRLGNIEFQMLAMEMEAASLLHAGEHDEARRQLRAVLSLGKERQVDRRLVYASLRLADSYFQTSEYEAARALLEQTAATPAARDELAIPIALGRAHARLGDFAGARERLEPALAAVEASGQLWLAPVARTTLGELELEAGNVRAAREHFEKSAGYWMDDLPDAASVEARCYLAGLDPDAPAASGAIASGIAQARNMGRLHSEAVCRVQDARVHLAGRRSAEALAALSAIPLDGERAVGKEMQAQVHHLRSRALEARGDEAAAKAEADRARALAQELAASMPAAFRERLAARLEIHQLVEARR
jgi:tetratricopeptide (TPR) repeat protein